MALEAVIWIDPNSVSPDGYNGVGGIDWNGKPWANPGQAWCLDCQANTKLLRRAI